MKIPSTEHRTPFDGDADNNGEDDMTMNKRTEILETAADLVNGDRERDYGTPQENFRRIAAGWSVLLEQDVTAEQVALCMAWLKLARLVNGPHPDSYVDAAAYMALAGELSEC